mmetsp:Transcript_21683/g.53566  ORF Transcript_21683/g.53566 Transcript_21683/m.53566 type:complete len:207 (+) Transcript_21683:362-982(+)
MVKAVRQLRYRQNLILLVTPHLPQQRSPSKSLHDNKRNDLLVLLFSLCSFWAPVQPRELTLVPDQMMRLPLRQLWSKLPPNRPRHHCPRQVLHQSKKFPCMIRQIRRIAPVSGSVSGGSKQHQHSLRIFLMPGRLARSLALRSLLSREVAGFAPPVCRRARFLASLSAASLSLPTDSPPLSAEHVACVESLYQRHLEILPWLFDPS